MEQITTIRNKLIDAFCDSEAIPASEIYARLKAGSGDLATRIDSTLLLPTATYGDIEKLCVDAKEYGFYSVCVPPSFLTYASDLLAESKVIPITVIGFPHGNSTTETKTFETLDAIDWGAKEVDMVMNISKLKSGKLDEVYQDVLSVVQQADQTPVKVILETSQLTTEEKIHAALLAQIAGASFIKTSTGFAMGGASVEDVALLKQIVGDQIGIKASDGIRSLDFARELIAAGANRIGTSVATNIIREHRGQ